VERAFREHLVLVFRDQPLDPEQFLAFSRCFGALQPHVTKRYRHPEYPEIVYMTNITETGEYDRAGAERGALAWHSDLAYDEIPAKCTLLHPIDLPDRGGNTKFANMYAAYETMPEALRARITGLKAEFRYGGRHGYGVEVLYEADRELPSVVHPVVRAHPDTGRRAVFVNPYHAACIVGMARDESDALLDEIFAWCERPEFQWEHEWRPDDTLVWENRCAWHLGPRDYPKDQARTFLRTTVRGTPTS
jgi:taurine dioxygenase